MTKGCTMGILEGYLNFYYQSARNSNHPSEVIIASELSIQHSLYNLNSTHLCTMCLCFMYMYVESTYI
jgi:hypothetical protein